MLFESENVEFKSQMVEDLYKEVIAFANTDGGTIFVGVDNQGNVIGIEEVDEVYMKITNGIRDAILPDVTMFIKYVLHENKVIRIEVGEGSFKPYYLKAKGLKPAGVFIRQGASSVPASPEQIRQMIKVSDGDIFETMRACEQDLTFERAMSAFEKYKVEFAQNKFAALGIRCLSDTLYTNLAWLISDQCRHTIKVAVFADEFNTVFKDSKEFGGSLFAQLEDAYAYLVLCNRNAARIEGLERIETPDYPPEAIREALLNAIVHRDYSFSGSIIINVNESGMEFISLGGLLPGLSAEDIRSGISQPRNRNLAEIFHRLRLIESYGTGIRKIFSLYNGCPMQPHIEVTPNTFKITLPNMNAADMRKTMADRLSLRRNTCETPQMQTVLAYLEEHGEMTENELMELLNVKRTRAFMLVKQMRDANLLIVQGRGDDKKFLLVK